MHPFIFDIVMAISESIPVHQEGLEICFQVIDVCGVIWLESKEAKFGYSKFFLNIALHMILE